MAHNDFTTPRYQESWAFFNPGKGTQITASFEGIVKFYEHCWWSGVALPVRLIAIENIPTFVIEAELARECSLKLRERYPYLEEICEILDNGLTYIQ